MHYHVFINCPDLLALLSYPTLEFLFLNCISYKSSSHTMCYDEYVIGLGGRLSPFGPR